MIREKEYFLAGQVLGGEYHMMMKHIMPVLKMRMTVITIQQFVQVLILLAHLGLLKIFVGGTSIQTTITGDAQMALSTTYEWSGLIGTYFYYLPLAPWLLLFPVGLFALTVFSANLILLGANDKRQLLKSNVGADRSIEIGENAPQYSHSFERIKNKEVI